MKTLKFETVFILNNIKMIADTHVLLKYSNPELQLQ